MSDIQLSPHFALSEFIFSQTAARKGIDNTPSPDVIASLKALCLNILDPLREHVGVPIHISSGYRSPKLNKAVGGRATSQHVLGQACDFRVSGMSVVAAVDLIQMLELPFDQLIKEFTSSPSGGWVHVSYSNRHRRQVLKIG